MAKSSFKNMLDFLFRRQQTKTKRNISPQEALNLQKQDQASVCEIGLPYTEPYFEIAKQLFSEKESVFNAAVYYLVRIAQNEPTTVSPICAILQNYAQKKPNPQRQEQIEKALQQICA